MYFWEIIAFIASFCGSISLIPEVRKALHTHHLQDIAWGWLMLLFACSLSWFIYGFSMNELPVVIASGFNIVMEIILALLKFHYDRTKIPLFEHVFKQTPKKTPKVPLSTFLKDKVT